MYENVKNENWQDLDKIIFRKRKAPDDEISSEVPTSSKKSRKSMSDDPSAQLKVNKYFRFVLVYLIIPNSKNLVTIWDTMEDAREVYEKFVTRRNWETSWN